MTDAVLVRINCPDAVCADRIADVLVQEHLAGCANIAGPVTSIYLWQGRRATRSEYVVWLKTTSGVQKHLFRRAGQLHPDEVPAILALECSDGDGAYLDWLNQQTGERQ